MRYHIKKFASGNYGIADSHSDYVCIIIGLTRDTAIVRCAELNSPYTL